MKIFLQKAVFQIGLQKTLWLTYIISDLSRMFGTFYEKELQKANQKKFRMEIVVNRNGDKLCVKWKG